MHAFGAEIAFLTRVGVFSSTEAQRPKVENGLPTVTYKGAGTPSAQAWRFFNYFGSF